MNVWTWTSPRSQGKARPQLRARMPRSLTRDHPGGWAQPWLAPPEQPELAPAAQPQALPLRPG
eukprot:10002740-Lingulodinium_polyedra.AAC.1